MMIHEVKQGSSEWLRLRIGIPTASNFHKILTPKTGKLSSQAAGYMNWLLAEWLLGEPLDSPETQWMHRGQALEDQAVRSYSFERNCEVEKVGFITDDDGLWGCSPDRLITSLNGVPTRGSLEIKCPSPQVHVGYMLSRAIGDDHKSQVQGQMFIADLDWVDVESYCPGLPTVIIRANRDEAFVTALRDTLRAFSETMLEARIRLAREYGPFLRETKKKDDELETEAQRVFDEIFLQISGPSYWNGEEDQHGF